MSALLMPSEETKGTSNEYPIIVINNNLVYRIQCHGNCCCFIYPQPTLDNVMPAMLEIGNFFFIWIFTNIHNSQDSWGRGRVSLKLLSTTSTCFKDTLDISWEIIVESLPLHISSSQTQAGKLWFLSTSSWPWSYAPRELETCI